MLKFSWTLLVSKGCFETTKIRAARM
jgi:hypothetical protein